MQFVYPGFLFALVAVSIPIIIHLFHFRRFRRIYFPNVTFLQQLSDESRKQSRLRHLLVLASRILAISFLVLAFSRPFIPASDSQISHESNAVGVYIDNSFSMEALAVRGRLLDQALDHARKIAALYQAGDRFLLLTNDFEGRHQRLTSRAEFLSLLDQVQQSPAVRTLAEVMQRKADLMQDARESSRSSYIISDFQKSTAGINDIIADTAVSAFFIPLSAQQAGNVFIDSIWLESPVKIYGQSVTMKVRIVNDNDQPMENQPLRLFIDGVQRAVASWDAPGGGQVELDVTWTINARGIRQGWVEISDYPVTFDDRMQFSYRTTSEIPVLSIDQGSASPFMQALFGRDTTFVLSSMPAAAIDFSRLGLFNLIILNNLNSIPAGLARELQQFARQGGSLVIFPGTSIAQDSYQDFLGSMGIDSYSGRDTSSTRVSGLNEGHEVFTGVFDKIPDNMDLPLVKQHYPIRRGSGSAGQYLLQLQNGNPFFSSYQYEKGNVFLSAVPLDEAYSNFPRHPVFVPLMINVALQSQAFLPLYYVSGQNEPILIPGPPPARDEVFQLRGHQLEIIPEQSHAGNITRLFFHDQVKVAENFLLYQGNDSVMGLSFNYDRRESLLEAYTIRELQDLLIDQGLATIHIIPPGEAAFEDSLQQLRLGRQLWRHFLILALIFLFAEIALLRFGK